MLVLMVTDILDGDYTNNLIVSLDFLVSNLKPKLQYVAVYRQKPEQL
jgi:hypothetical protein